MYVLVVLVLSFVESALSLCVYTDITVRVFYRSPHSQLAHFFLKKKREKEIMIEEQDDISNDEDNEEAEEIEAEDRLPQSDEEFPEEEEEEEEFYQPKEADERVPINCYFIN